MVYPKNLQKTNETVPFGFVCFSRSQNYERENFLAKGKLGGKWEYFRIDYELLFEEIKFIVYKVRHLEACV
jgi:hypothetical protein